MHSTPKVSIFTAVKNGEEFLIDTIESVLNQTFKDYEHVIVDGASTDKTIDILKQYPHLKWISEPDSGPAEGFHKAIKMCRGDYVFQCCVSDGFLDKKWFETCVKILDSNPDVSMVYGLPQYMSENGHLEKIAYSDFFEQPPPQKQDFLPFWLATRFIFPEGNYCVRRKVFIECFPSSDSDDFYDRVNPFMKFVYNFNVNGYLPYFVPYIANFGRVHQNQVTERLQIDAEKTYAIYVNDVDKYKLGLMADTLPHTFRDGIGNSLGYLQDASSDAFKKKIKSYIQTYQIYFDTPTSLGTVKESRMKIRLINYLKRILNYAIKRLDS
jgi:glycosyltransferase involved in cell wall biosynthesis